MCTSVDELQNVEELQRKVQFIANILILLHIIVDAAIFIDFSVPDTDDDSDSYTDYYGFLFKTMWIILVIPIILSLYGAKTKKRHFLLPILTILVLLLVLVSPLSVFLCITTIISVVFLVRSASDTSENKYLNQHILCLSFLASFVGLFIVLLVGLAVLDMFLVTKNLYSLLTKEASIESVREPYDINLEQQNTTDLLVNDNESSAPNNDATSIEANDEPRCVNLPESSLSNATLDKNHPKPTLDLPPGYTEIIEVERDIISQSPPTYQDAMKIE